MSDSDKIERLERDVRLLRQTITELSSGMNAEVEKLEKRVKKLESDLNLAMIQIANLEVK